MHRVLLNVFVVYFDVYWVFITVKYNRIRSTDFTKKFSKLQLVLSIVLIFKFSLCAISQFAIQGLMIANINQSSETELIQWMQLGHDAYYSFISIAEGMIILEIGKRYETVVNEIE